MQCKYNIRELLKIQKRSYHLISNRNVNNDFVSIVTKKKRLLQLFREFGRTELQINRRRFSPIKLQQSDIT